MQLEISQYYDKNHLDLVHHLSLVTNNASMSTAPATFSWRFWGHYIWPRKKIFVTVKTSWPCPGDSCQTITFKISWVEWPRYTLKILKWTDPENFKMNRNGNTILSEDIWPRKKIFVFQVTYLIFIKHFSFIWELETPWSKFEMEFPFPNEILYLPIT